jgi:hypothetical protein
MQNVKNKMANIFLLILGVGDVVERSLRVVDGNYN